MQKMIRVLKWGVGLLLLIVAGFLSIWLLAPDEELHPAVAEIMAKPALPPDHENGYYAVLGLRASPELDAHAVGRKIVEAHEAIVAADGSLKDFSLESYLGPASVKAPGTHRYCAMDSRSCLSFHRANADAVLAETETYKLTLQRYRALRSFPAFSERVLTPRIEFVHLEYAMLTAMSNLVDAGIAIDVASPERRAQGIDELMGELRLWRNLFYESDGLITRMIAVATLQRKLRLASEIMNAYPETVVAHREEMEEITLPLRQEKIDFGRILRHELLFAVSVSLSLDRFYSESDYPRSFREKATEAIGMIGYKPNATANEVYALYLENVRHFSKSPEEIVSGQAALNERLERSGRFAADMLFYNGLGKALVRMGALDMSDYAFRLHDLSSYSRMVEAQRRLIEARVPPEGMADFLARRVPDLVDVHTGQPFAFDATTRTIFFTGRGSRLPEDGLVRVRVDRL